MPDSVAIVMMVERASENVRPDGVKFTEERGQPGKAVVRSFWRNAVDFATIAGGKHQRFIQNPARAQFVGSPAGLIGGERHLFTHPKGRPWGVQDGQGDVHS